ncbi:c-type cytochrome [Lichenicoccus sp.]|uniref:c-type cytochrome n=1 Tax=Lichenicoccus sp. TaxID=2781899 RepID=UPI003D115B27
MRRVILAAASLCWTGPALADAASSAGSSTVQAATGQLVYQHVCQGCHMANGQGGVGAARIPALAHNAKLESSGYPVYVVLNGLGGMPWFNGMLSDQQIAAVITYVRTHFGNDYKDAVAPADIAAVRGPAPTKEN